MALKTPNDGAATERRAIRKHILTLMTPGHTSIDGEKLIEWISGRTKRNAQRKGGLGKK